MNLLPLLPVEIWREHILQCVALVDIVKVSSSFCSHQLQRQFQSMANGLNLHPFVAAYTGYAERLRWCQSRNILIRSLSIFEEIDEESASLLPRIRTMVTRLTLLKTTQNFEPTEYAHLVHLQFFNCSLQSVGKLLECPSLTTLSVKECHNLTTESLLTSLSGCMQLKECSIESCELIDQRIITLLWKQVPGLVSFQFEGLYRLQNILSAAGVTCDLQCSESSHMCSVVLSGCFVTSRGVRNIAMQFPQLQKLHLDDSTCNASDADIVFLCRHCTHLSDLALRRFHHLSSTALTCIAKHLPLLQRLCVAFCMNISDEGVISIAKGCVQLKSLDLSYCVDITDNAVREVLTCLQLQELKLSGCVLVTDAAFTHQMHGTLRVLNLSHTLLQGTFYKHTPKLVRLVCDNCCRFNSTFVQAVVDCPNVWEALFWTEKIERVRPVRRAVYACAALTHTVHLIQQSRRRGDAKRCYLLPLLAVLNSEKLKSSDTATKVQEGAGYFTFVAQVYSPQCSKLAFVLYTVIIA